MFARTKAVRTNPRCEMQWSGQSRRDSERPSPILASYRFFCNNSPNSVHPTALLPGI